MPIVPVVTSNSQEMIAQHYFPYSAWPKLSVKSYKLPDFYSFDLERMRYQVEEIRSAYGFKPFNIRLKDKKIRRTYRGIGLTFRPNAEDPLYDALRQSSASEELDISETFYKQRMSLSATERHFTPTYELNYSKKNHLYDGYIAETLNRFQSPMTKVRLSELGPRGLLASHVDFPYYEQIRVHAVLYTNKDSWWSVDGDEFQIPADGSFYWFDTGKYHGVWNDGDSARLVLSVNLSVYRDREGKPLYGPESGLIELFDSCKV